MKNEIINLKRIIAKIADVELQEKLIIMIDQSDNFHPLVATPLLGQKLHRVV